MINKFPTYHKLKTELNNHRVIYFILLATCIIAFYLRIYRLGDFLGFFYDQGRDALVIWKLWHERKLFLVGPVTGLEGIFLGPLYYYLITPFYILGKGNPVFPAVFLAFTSTLAIPVVYYLGGKFFSREAGLFAAVISAFSFYVVHSGRWLSNPTPILLISVLFLLSLYKISLGKDKKWWILATLLLGISLQFESASAFFYIPTYLILIYKNRRKLPSIKIAAVSMGVLLLTLLPQIIFNYRHDYLLSNNFYKLFFKERSFRLDVGQILFTRIKYFWTVFYSKIFPGNQSYMAIFILCLSVILFIKRPLISKTRPVWILSLFLSTPVAGYLLFQGNHGNIYDYYLTGYYLPMIIFFSLGLALIWKYSMGKFMIAIFFLLFFILNGNAHLKYFAKNINSSDSYTLKNEIMAVDWVLDHADSVPFNVDIYVPPVIPYAYDYLFKWRGNLKCGSNMCGLEQYETDNLFTVYEFDNERPQNLSGWLQNHDKISKVINEVHFGGITVQQRQRI